MICNFICQVTVYPNHAVIKQSKTRKLGVSREPSINLTDIEETDHDTIIHSDECIPQIRIDKGKEIQQ